MLARRDFDSGIALLGYLRDLGGHLKRWQTHFSGVSAALALTLALTLMVDYAVGHQHIARGPVALWMGGYALFVLLPLLLGRRYPKWLGLVFVGYLSYWSVSSLLRTNHPHMELNVLLEAPVVALYLGWFFRPWVARTTLGVYLIGISAAVLFGPYDVPHAFSSNLALLYALLIAGFCLETGAYLRRRAARQSRHDPLTGALNRRGLVEYGERALSRARRTGAPLTLAAIDFDDFKAINDAGGHAVGDAALCESAALWMRGLDPQDLVVRTGGDEFVLLIHADEVQAAARLAALRKQAEYPWSWGLAQYRPGDLLDDLTRLADTRLYRAKEHRSGRTG